MDAQASLCSRVELSFSAIELANLDLLSKTDPFVVVFAQYGRSGQWHEIGRTEVIKDTLNPKWVRAITMDYFFEEVQPLRFVVYDEDLMGGRLDQQDLVGEMGCTLAEICGSKGQRVTRPIKNDMKPGRKNGFLSVCAEELQGLSFTVTMDFSASKLDKKDWFFGKSDPFLVINRMREDSTCIPVVKTEVVKRNLNPKWKPVRASIIRLCNGDYDRPLVIECWDWNSSGTHDWIGKITTSLRQLLDKKVGEFTLMNDKKKGKQESGTLHLNSIKMEQEYSFLDFIKGGCELNFIVAVDFTSSNGNPSNPNSLHYRGGNNEYVSAISAVGEVLQNYDSDQRFPAFGFGARIPPTGQVSHCFPLNSNPYDAEVIGIHGILNAYHHCLGTVTLYGPTIFSQIIRRAADYAARHVTQHSQNYFVLLIITDGIINDMDATIAEIVRASSLPLSVIIVGVGAADFGNMQVLDADEVPLQSGGRFMERDIVQFVPYRDFKGVHHSRLAKEVLKEVPGQLLSFMKKKSIKPNPPIRQDSSESFARAHLEVDRAPQDAFAPVTSAPQPVQYGQPAYPPQAPSTSYGAPQMPVIPQDFPFRPQLDQLNTMGFMDNQKNINALLDSNGDVNGAVTKLMAV